MSFSWSSLSISKTRYFSSHESIFNEGTNRFFVDLLIIGCLIINVIEIKWRFLEIFSEIHFLPILDRQLLIFANCYLAMIIDTNYICFSFLQLLLIHRTFSNSHSYSRGFFSLQFFQRFLLYHIIRKFIQTL